MEHTNDIETTPLLASKHGSGRHQGSKPTKSWNFLTRFRDISVSAYLLIVVFSVSSYIATLGIDVEVPLMIHRLPEGWSLPSYFTLILQFGNVGPIAYVVVNWWLPDRVKDWVVIAFIVTLSAAASLLMAFFWQETSMLGGRLHSTACLSLYACMSISDATSTVVYLAYLANFKSQYMSALFIGEAFSGLLPAVVAMIQDVGDTVCHNTTINPEVNATATTLAYSDYTRGRFSTKVFFFAIAVMFLASGIAFSILHFSTLYDDQRIGKTSTDRGAAGVRTLRAASVITSEQVPEITVDADAAADDVFVDDHCQEPSTSNDPIKLVVPLTQRKPLLTASLTSIPSDFQVSVKAPTEAKFQMTSDVVQLLVMATWASAYYSTILPAVSSYSCVPYSGSTYGLAVQITAISIPFGCFMTLVYPVVSVATLRLLTFIASLLAGYVIYLAAASPNPPLQGKVSGQILVVSSLHVLKSTLLWVSDIIIGPVFVAFVVVFQISSLSVSSGTYFFVMASTASLLRSCGGKKGLVWCGSLIQLGSFAGAVLIFTLINLLEVFTDAGIENC